MTPEGRVKAAVDRVLTEHAFNRGGLWTFKPVQSGYGKRALDYLCCVRGHMFAIETKALEKDLTLLQRACARDIYKAGGTVWFIRNPHTVKVFAKWLEER